MVEQFINTLILHMDDDSNRHIKEPIRYLEIGVDTGNTWTQILTTTPKGREVIKVGVDPYGKYTDGITRMTSQMFFAINEGFQKQEFDIIYIDACHFSYIVDQEVAESFKILRKNGIVLLDDTIPLEEASGTVHAEDLVSYCDKVSYPIGIDHTEAVQEFSGYPHVQGDVWKSVAKLRMKNPELSICSIGSLCTTMIMRGKQDLMEKVADEDINWDFYLKNNKEILQQVKVWDDINHYLNANYQP